MSGGHWNYAGFQLQDQLQEIGGDEAVQRRWPRIGSALVRLADVLYELEHAMDWDLSGDSIIENDGAWQAEAMERLHAAVTDDPAGPFV